MDTTGQAPDKPRLGIGDVLRHLVTHANTSGEDNRAAFLEAVNAEYGAPPEPDVPVEDKAAEDATDPRDAEIDRLKAELAARVLRPFPGKPEEGQ